MNYVGGTEASKILGVHQRTLYLWDTNGKIDTIRTPGGKRLYNVEKFLKEKQGLTINNSTDHNDPLESMDRIKIAYVRVSSHSQKDDLERQKQYVKRRFPKHVLIEDIGSGINLNRRGLNKIIHLAIKGKVEEVVVAYKDRLARFGFELIEDIIQKYSNGTIKIINNVKKQEPEEELVKDMLQIMNIFVAKMNGLRKYKNNEDNNQ